MQHMHILVLGPKGPGRAGLEDTLSRLGHLITTSETVWQAQAPPEGEVVVLDLRDGDQDWRRLTAGLREDRRPLVVVADQPRRLIWALSGRPAGMMVLTGAESDGSYRVALRLCEALRQGQRERSGGDDDDVVYAAGSATM